MMEELEFLCKKCPRLKVLYNKQKTSGLDKKTWRSIMRLFVNAGRIALAKRFSKLSKKHDYEDDEYIDILSVQRPSKDVYCVNLGCTKANIRKCFQNIEKNVEDKIINSPAGKVAFDEDEKMDAGFENRKNKEGEIVLDINPNLYVEHILKNYKLLVQENEKYYLYRNNHWKPISDMKLGRILRFFFRKFESERWTTSLAGKYMGALCYECWDMDDVVSAEDYINVKNGLLNLNTFKLEAHDRRIFTTNQIPVIYNDTEKEYDFQKECPEFMNFLWTIFDDHSSRVKQKLIDFVQEIMGYCLSNSVKAHKFFMFIGDGSNGKSILCDILTELSGGVGNVSNVALRNFSKQFALSQIMDKTLNISTENEVSGNLDTQTIKAIVSGEAMQMEEKFKMPLSYRPTAKLVFAVNTMPKTKDKSYGFGRRLICIPFNIRFVEDEPKHDMERTANPELMEKLLEELNGIFAFAIEGLKRLREREYKFVIPKFVKMKMEEYKADNNPHLAFVKECIVADEKAIKVVDQKTIYNVFFEWCAQEGLAEARKANPNVKAFMKDFRVAIKDVHIAIKEETHNDRIYPLSGIKLSAKGEELLKVVRKRENAKYYTEI
jgi:putative DNA primase/helicase